MMKINKTHFELNGYLVLPNIVPKSTLIKLNKNADQMINDFKKGVNRKQSNNNERIHLIYSYPHRHGEPSSSWA